MSQMRSNQKVRVYQREQHVTDYFATHPGTPHTVCMRGAEHVAMRIGSARLYVSAHRTKRFVIALKYDGEEAYRYLIASDLSWRTLDIVQAYTLRWLVEVFVQDWSILLPNAARPDQLLGPDSVSRQQGRHCGLGVVQDANPSEPAGRGHGGCAAGQPPVPRRPAAGVRGRQGLADVW